MTRKEFTQQIAIALCSNPAIVSGTSNATLKQIFRFAEMLTILFCDAHDEDEVSLSDIRETLAGWLSEIHCELTEANLLRREQMERNGD